jgi:hypothetical protein
MLKAALTAQDRGESPANGAPETVKTSLSLLHNPAFPCLRHAKGEVIEDVDAMEGHEVVDISSVRLAGTAPSIGLADHLVWFLLEFVRTPMQWVPFSMTYRVALLFHDTAFGDAMGVASAPRGHPCSLILNVMKFPNGCEPSRGDRKVGPAACRTAARGDGSTQVCVLACRRITNSTLSSAEVVKRSSAPVSWCAAPVQASGAFATQFLPLS